MVCCVPLRVLVAAFANGSDRRQSALVDVLC